MTRDQEIREEAYLLSEEAGHPPGRSEEFWLKAEAKVLGRLSEAKSSVEDALAKVFSFVAKVVSSATRK